MNKKKLIGAVLAVGAAAASVVGLNAFADWQHFGYLGDINTDNQVTIADAVLLTKHLIRESALTLDNTYDLRNRYITVDDGEPFWATDLLDTADLDSNGIVDVYDLVILKQHLVNNIDTNVWVWEEEETTITTTETSHIHEPTTTDTTTEAEFIAPPIYDLYGSLPSQGDAEIVVFYVDFPDCRFGYKPSIEKLNEIMFGDENEASPYYPYESMKAYYKRASKGSMDLNGKVYTYTTKNAKSYYEDNVWHVNLIEEILAEFDANVDFSQFDGDNDRIVDSILVCVPEESGSDNWWSAAGIYGGDRDNRVEGMSIGHVIVGFDQVVSDTDYRNFISSYAHEMGHCMGLPDIYIYNREDFQGMHGSGGFEAMDDAIGDFGALSKLMCGWYREDQIMVYDRSLGAQTYVLEDSETDKGNCLIIPNSYLGDKYRSEFMIVEYATLNGNNSKLTDNWWRATGSGVRIYHCDTVENGEYYNSFKYAAKDLESTKDNEGRRFIRLVGEGTDSTDNLYRSGIVDSSIREFNWYDSNDDMTIDPGVYLTISENSDGTYSVTVMPK